MRGKREPWSRGMSDPTVAKQTVGHTLLFQVQDDKTKVKTTKPRSRRQNQVQDKTKFKTKPSSRQNQVQDDKTKFKTKPSSRQNQSSRYPPKVMTSFMNSPLTV